MRTLRTQSIHAHIVHSCDICAMLLRMFFSQAALLSSPCRTKEVFVNEHRVVIRYNDTCHFYQPPRAHHCSVNDNCVERFDHHCPWWVIPGIEIKGPQINSTKP